MAGKIQGDIDGESAGKVLGGLEKTPIDDVADVADSSSYASTSDYYGGGGDGGGSDYTGYGNSGRGGGALDPEDSDDSGDSEDSDSADSEGSEDLTDSEDSTDEPSDNEPSENDPSDNQMWTQPDEHRTGDDTGDDTGGGTDGDGGTGDRRVSMDIQAMTTLIAAMERARDQIPEYQAEFRKILLDVDLLETAYPDADRLPQVVAWIEDELPGLRRRLALAQALEDDTLRTQPDRGLPHARPPVTYFEHHVPDHPPHVSTEHGRELVSLLTTQPDQVERLVAKLTGNQHDPYFTHQFTGEADPADVTAVIEAARARDDIDPARVDELESLVRAAVRTAARGTGELAPGGDFDDRWRQFAPASGAPATA
ncbi:hypothetical protein G1H11_13500 [Phytoactinopolyspora alkaliphila]|uniref:Uncharacterized protein n=1 Tax=Phytoactinopolyspora alkaliphila TaxID=1783498 RepID=A0A6N9YMW8_9ACTN|nr:hypothetical protein [Phytoactinopolyspora alkaliphila]NED96324.1 hypothetical protein [Phytoactinopolyspora alkaliphila]